MKSKGQRGLIVIVSAGVLAACTTNAPTAYTPPPRNGHTIARTYTQADLDRSGRATTAEALEQIDPDVRVRKH